jgi:anti-sigma-K factor RskA
VAHLNAELLAGQALGQTDELDAEQLKHVASCPQCRAEVDQLHRIVELGQEGPGPDSPPIPDQAMWRNIAAELSIGQAADPRSGLSQDAESPAESAAESPQQTAPPQARRGPRRSAVALAAAIGLIAGVGGTVLADALREPEAQVVASATLNPLPGQAGQGTAQLVREGETTELRVAVTGAAPPPAQEYREVWLINTDGERMYSLGVLPVGGAGAYVVPAGLDDSLDGFTIVDVSLEPYDGNAAHSLRSQVRGTLPV